MPNKDQFFEVYASKLVEYKLKHPDHYLWRNDDFEDVLPRMFNAIIIGGYDLRGPAIRATCRALKIPCSYQSIREVIHNAD